MNNSISISKDNLDIEPGSDFSWIKEQERLQNIQNNYFREPMEKIHIKYIYINQNKYISKILCEVFELNFGDVISQEYLLRLIEKNKFQTPTTKYKLIDILLFNVYLEPELIPTYSKNDDFVDFSRQFLNVLSPLNNIQIPESIFIFHDVNTLYFIFQEYETELTKNSIKSILKKEDNREPAISKKTKKVRITIGNKTKHIHKQTHGTRRNKIIC